MKIPHQALVALANGERLVIMRNVGQPFEPKLEKVSEPDLLLTNFSAGVRHQDPAGQRNGSTDVDELAHGAAIAEWFNKATLNGAKIHYQSYGGNGKEAFVLVHGWSCSLDYWKYQIPDLAKRSRVIALDLLGFGQSPAPASELPLPAQFIVGLPQVVSPLPSTQ